MWNQVSVLRFSADGSVITVMTKMNSGEKTKYYKHVLFYSYISLDQSSREKQNKIHLPAAVAQGLRFRVQIYTLPGTEASFSKDLKWDIPRGLIWGGGKKVKVTGQKLDRRLDGVNVPKDRQRNAAIMSEILNNSSNPDHDLIIIFENIRLEAKILKELLGWTNAGPFVGLVGVWRSWIFSINTFHRHT